jgi:hypothetical protein
MASLFGVYPNGGPVRVGTAGIAMMIVWLAAAPPVQAQMPAPAHFESWQPDLRARTGRITLRDSTTAKGSGSGMVLGGIGGTLIGWIAGGLVGGALTRTHGEDAQWEGAIYGAMVGATAGVAVGVHMGNHSQGNLLNDLLVSAGIGAVGIVLTSATQSALPILLTPLAQVIATIALEDHASRKATLRDASQ